MINESNWLDIAIQGNKERMRDLTEGNELDGLKKLRAFFGGRDIYVGGSYALNKYVTSFGMEVHWNDIDVYVLGLRNVEAWVFAQFLERNFDHYWRLGSTGDAHSENYYRIHKQFQLWRANLNGFAYDIIFVNDNIEGLLEHTACDLSKFYYQVDYSPEYLRMSYPVKQAIKDREGNKMSINTHESVCTVMHLNKMRDRAKQLGFDLCEYSEDIGEPDNTVCDDDDPFSGEKILKIYSDYAQKLG